jgi:Spy/CpxP family protein refolding chaperone
MSTSFARRALRAATQAAVATSLVAVVAAAVQAQQPVSKDPPAGQPPAGGGQGGGGGRGGNRGMQMLMEGITLSAEQQTKVDSISGAFRERMMGMGRPQQGDTTGMGARLKLMSDRNAAIRGVLTADQQKAFDANVARMPQMGGGRPPTER